MCNRLLNFSKPDRIGRYGARHIEKQYPGIKIDLGVDVGSPQPHEMSSFFGIDKDYGIVSVAKRSFVNRGGFEYLVISSAARVKATP
jgi:hypothetical protein